MGKSCLWQIFVMAIDVSLEHVIDIPDSSSCIIPLHVFASGFQTLPTTSPIVLLIHGAGGDHFHFDTTIPILVKAGYRVLTCDLRCHGASQPTRPEEDGIFTFQTIVDDFDQILRWVKKEYCWCEKVELLIGGLSMGGMIAQVCVQERRQSWELELGFFVRTLIAIACPSTSMIWPRMAWMDMYRDMETPDRNLTQVAQMSIAASAVTGHGKKEAERAISLINDRTLFQCLRSCALALPAPHHSPTTTVPQFEQNSILTISQLLITGHEDPHTIQVMKAWHTFNMEKTIPSRFYSIPNAGHMVPLDAGDRLAELILSSSSK